MQGRICCWKTQRFLLASVAVFSFHLWEWSAVLMATLSTSSYSPCSREAARRYLLLPDLLHTQRRAQDCCSSRACVALGTCTLLDGNLGGKGGGPSGIDVLSHPQGIGRDAGRTHAVCQLAWSSKALSSQPVLHKWEAVACRGCSWCRLSACLG